MQLPPIMSKEQREPIRHVRWPFIERHARGAQANAALEFGRFRVLLRQRRLLADGVPVELGTRALDLLMVLIEADGALVSKDKLLALAWPGIFVDETNIKVQISALRRALGEDRDFIRTEVGRGYRFTAAIRSTAAFPENPRPMRRKHRSPRKMCRKLAAWRARHNWCASRLSRPRR